MLINSRLREVLLRDGVAVLVTVERADGSTPREAGAAMVVTRLGDMLGTIGGGALEWEALRIARDLLVADAPAVLRRDFSLGPNLAQCCGGRVGLCFERFGAGDVARATALAETEMAASAVTQLALFGAGHVGRALVLALAPLPFSTRWIDERAEAFPGLAPANVLKIATADPASELDALDRGAFVLVMTHSHARDLEIVTRALSMRRFGHVGLIGSASKRARFEHRMAEAGIAEDLRASLTCPIGLPGLEGKEPAIIAASVAASLLLVRERMRYGQKDTTNEQ